MSSCPPYGTAGANGLGGQAPGLNHGNGVQQATSSAGGQNPTHQNGGQGRTNSSSSAFPSNHLNHLSDLASNFANSGGLAAPHHSHHGLSASGLTINLAAGATGGLNLQGQGQLGQGLGQASSTTRQTAVQQPAVPGHYGVTVNGFHPQVNARVNPVVGVKYAPLPSVGGSSIAQSSLGPSLGLNQSMVRHQPAVVSSVSSAGRNNQSGSSSHARSSLERNQREAERAQKITRLITDIKVSMEEGGWKEEMKSKYQTLSQ